MSDNLPEWALLQLEHLESMVARARENNRTIDVYFTGRLLDGSNMVQLAPDLYGVMTCAIDPITLTGNYKMAVEINVNALDNFCKGARKKAFSIGDVIRPLSGKWKVATGQIDSMTDRWLFVVFQTLTGKELVKVAKENAVKVFDHEN